jgi:hypothetical protein
MLREVAFLDELIRPERLEQFLLADHAVAVIDQVEQQVKGFPVQGNRLSTPA